MKVLVTVRTGNGLIVECELTPKTIKELKTNNMVSVRKLSGGKGLIVECDLTTKTIKELKTKNIISVKELSGGEK